MDSRFRGNDEIVWIFTTPFSMEERPNLTPISAHFIMNNYLDGYRPRASKSIEWRANLMLTKEIHNASC